MTVIDQTRLFGSYEPCPAAIGDRVFCSVRRVEIVVTDFSAATWPWPRFRAGRGWAFPVFGDLERAIRREFLAAVCHHWGLTYGVARGYRRALGVGRTTTEQRALLAPSQAASQREGVKSLPGEVWADVPGTDGLYQASTEGRLARILDGQRFILTPSATPKGHDTCNMSVYGQTLTRSVPLTIARTFLPDKPADVHRVKFRDGDRKNYRLANLYWR